MDLRDRRYWLELKQQFLSAATYLLSAFEGMNFMLAFHKFPGQEVSGLFVIILALCGMGSMILGNARFERLVCYTLSVICILHAIIMRCIMTKAPDEFEFVIMLALPVALMLRAIDIEEDL